MAITSRTLLILAIFLSSVSAHFVLNYPNSLGFDDDNEGLAPCGGFDVTFSNASDFHLGEDAIALRSTHPAALFGFRATLNKKAAGNWTSILPVISEQGLGSFCATGARIPENWAGQQGVIQVIQEGPDGQLYQCAAVNFVTGSNPERPSACFNSSDVTATITQATGFSSIPATAAPTVESSSGQSATATGSAAAQSSTGAASNLDAAGSLLWLGGAAVWALW